MISNKTLKDTLDGIKKISKIDLFVYDSKGKIVANTSDVDDKTSDAVFKFIESKKEKDEKSSLCFYKLVNNQVLVAKGKDAKMIGEMTAFQIENLISNTDNKTDIGELVKKILSNDLLPKDLKKQVNELGVEFKGKKCVFIIKSEHEKNGIVIEALQNALVEDGDLISDVDDKNIVLIKELVDTKDYAEASEVAFSIVDMLNTEIMQNARVSYSTIIDSIAETTRAYQEASEALEIGEIFKIQEQVISYNDLGIEKWIYKMPFTMCKFFLDEVFLGKTDRVFDEEAAKIFYDETLNTVEKLFENNLNISETARQLFIHRNTLVYRIDKIYKKTGLDLRNFEDALIFKIAIMVNQYKDYLEEKEQ